MTASAQEAHPPPQSRNVRVLHVYSGNLFGGIETFLLTLARYQAHTCAVMEFALCFEGKLSDELRQRGAGVHLLGSVRARSPKSVVAARRSLRRVLERGPYDVVVCHSAWAHALFASAVRKHGARLVFYLHDVPNRRGWLDQLANRTRPDRVICNSRFTAASAPWFFSGVPRCVIHCPVELDTIPSTPARAAVRASLETSEEAIVVLQVSRMQAMKGHRLLIEALGQMRGNPRWVCWIAGGAQRSQELEYEAELSRLVGRLGLERRVRLLGQRSDVPALMRAADIFCQPNLSADAFGIVFIEALAAGLPAITTAMGGPPEIVNESCGRLVKPDALDLATVLASVIDDDEMRIALSRTGPARARELCDARRCTASLAAELARGPSFSDFVLAARRP